MSTGPVQAQPASKEASSHGRAVLTRFMVFSVATTIALMALWTQVSPWLSYPVAVLSDIVLNQTAPMWVRSVEVQPGQMLVKTAVEVVIPNSGGRKAAAILPADPGRLAYGFPILLALLLSSWAIMRRPGLVQRALAGYALLLPTQTFSLVMFVLMNLAAGAQYDTRALRVDPWQIEPIDFRSQVATLVLPALMPVLIWLWLDRKFFNDVIVHGWKQSLEAKKQSGASEGANG